MEVALVADLNLGIQHFERGTGQKAPRFLSCPLDIAKVFDKTAEHLEKLKSNDSLLFKVIRLPCLIVSHNAVDHCLSYNNSFIECYKDEAGNEVKKAYLPDYDGSYHREFKDIIDDPMYAEGFRKVKEEVANIFVCLGYNRHNVKFLKGNYTKKAAQRGSLHCIAKVLERTKYQLTT